MTDPPESPTPSDDELSAIASAYGARFESMRLLGEGATAWVYEIEGDRVIRFPRGDEGVAALRREAAVLPLLMRSGIPVPLLLSVDDPPSIASRPHSVLSRIEGAPLTDSVASGAAARPALRAAATHLATLHQIAIESPPASVRDLRGDDGNGREWIPNLLTTGLLTQLQANWIEEVLSTLDDNDAFSAVSLLHGDLRPNNLMTTTQAGAKRLVGVIDWGDASFGPPVVDFGCLPPLLLPAFLDAYCQAWPAAPVSPASVLRIHFGWAVSAIGREPRPHEETWSSSPGGRLLELLRLAADPPASWRETLALLRHPAPAP